MTASISGHIAFSPQRSLLFSKKPPAFFPNIQLQVRDHGDRAPLAPYLGHHDCRPSSTCRGPSCFQRHLRARYIPSLHQPSTYTNTRLPEKRSSNDILFWQRATPACTGPGCYRRPYVFATYTGMDLCQVGAQVGDYDYKSACNTAWEMYGNWYWMGECDGSIKDWSAVSPGTFVGNLYTWNNKYLGPCSATSHSGKETCDGTATSLVRCALP